MNVNVAYSQWSSTYDEDENLTRDLDAQITSAMFSDQRFKSVLELGCGTGKNTALLARIAASVHALDFSEAMMERAKSKASAPNVRFEVADITQPWPCANESVDLITCNLVLEHIRELTFVFSEAARVLIHGGRFFVSELHPVRQYRGVQAQFNRDQGTTKIDAFIHDVTDFTAAARHNRLYLETINEWRHEEDKGKPPRLISFMFRK